MKNYLNFALMGLAANVSAQDYRSVECQTLGPGQTLQVDGWSKSDGKMTRFYFSSPQRSYANPVGRSDNVGVIGVAVFSEKPHPPVSPHPYARNQSSAYQSNVEVSEAMTTPSLDTGHGEREYSYVNQTHFQRNASPIEAFRIEYETWKVLNDKGVIPHLQHLNQREPFFADQYVLIPQCGGNV